MFELLESATFGLNSDSAHSGHPLNQLHDLWCFLNSIEGVQINAGHLLAAHYPLQLSNSLFVTRAGKMCRSEQI